MSIQINMTSAKESGSHGFIWGIDSQPSPLQPSQPSKFHIPMVENAAVGRKRKKPNEKNHLQESSDHETHIWTERERRKKMREMFTKLHALLPQLPPKVDKTTIVDEAVSLIQTLEQTLKQLQMQKHGKHQHSVASNTNVAYNPFQSPSSTTLLTPTSNHPQVPPVDSYSREAFLAKNISSPSTVMPYPCNDPIVAFDTWTSRNVVLNICGNEAIFNICFPKGKSGVFTTVCYFFKKYNIEVLFANVSSNVFRINYMIQAQVNSNHENQMLGNGIGVGDIFKQAAQELVSYFSSP